MEQLEFSLEITPFYHSYRFVVAHEYALLVCCLPLRAHEIIICYF